MRRELLISACLVSAGVHAALLPHHLRETLVIGISFAPAALLAVAAAVALQIWPQSPWPPRAAAALLLGLILAYILATALAIPGIDGTPEPIDPIGVITKAVEAVGFGLALSLSRASWEQTSRFPSGQARLWQREA